MLINIAWVVTVIGALTVLLVPKKHAVAAGILTAMALATLVPSFGPEAFDLLTLTLMATAVVFVSLLRVLAEIGQQRPQWLLILYIAYTSFAYLQNRSQNNSYLVLASGLLMILLVFAARYAADHGLKILVWSIPALIVFEFIIGFSEEVLGQPALSPTPNGIDRISSRVNYFATFLPGRALGSFASPLVYGTVAAVGVFVCLWMFTKTKRRRWFALTIVAALCLLYSGSRSPLLILGICLALWAISSLRVKNAYVLILSALVFIAGALSLNVTTLLGFDDFDESRSYVHRIGVVDSISNLLTQQHLAQVLFGNGATASDLIGGIVEGIESVGVFDNQYVSELAKSGVIGLVLLLAVIIDGFRRSGLYGRILSIMLALTLFTYDALTWRIVFIIAVVVWAGPEDPAAKTSGLDAELTGSDMAAPLPPNRNYVVTRPSAVRSGAAAGTPRHSMKGL